MGIISILINIALFNWFIKLYFSLYHSDEAYIIGILYLGFWLFSVIYAFYNVKGFSLTRFLDTPVNTQIYKRKLIANNFPKNIVCGKCKKTFTTIGLGVTKCPHCGCVNII